MRDDQLHISFYAIEQPLEKPGVTDEIEIYKIPREFPTRRPRFALLPGKAQARTGARTLVIEWRSPVYRKALRLGRYGRGLRRRQVLMELPEEEKVNPAEVGLGLPPEVTDAQIHALDQLDAARRGGLVTELEFQRRRRLILQGRLEEAGYETPAPGAARFVRPGPTTRSRARGHPDRRSGSCWTPIPGSTTCSRWLWPWPRPDWNSRRLRPSPATRRSKR